MKVQCPNCNTVHGADDATAQPSRLAAMILIAVIGIAAGWTTGFFCGGILTKPNRQKVDAEIGEIKAQNARLTADHEFSQTDLSPELRANLSVLCECWADYSCLGIFDSMRGTLLTGGFPGKFHFVLESSVKVLDDRLTTITKRPPIEDEALRECSRQIVNAMVAEKKLHRGFIDFLQSDMRGDFQAEELSVARKDAGWAAVASLSIQLSRFGIFE